MKMSGLIACSLVALGLPLAALARPLGGGMGAAPTAVHPSVTPGSTYTVPAGTTTGPQTVTTPYTGVVNNGTINGGSSTGLTTSGSVTSVTNNGTITSSTTGVSSTGGSSKITNNGTISVTGSSTAVGISQTSH